MSGNTHTDDQHETTDSLAPTREHEAAVEALAADTDRNDNLDAAAIRGLSLAVMDSLESADSTSRSLDHRHGGLTDVRVSENSSHGR